MKWGKNNDWFKSETLPMHIDEGNSLSMYIKYNKQHTCIPIFYLYYGNEIEITIRFWLCV